MFLICFKMMAASRCCGGNVIIIRHIIKVFGRQRVTYVSVNVESLRVGRTPGPISPELSDSEWDGGNAGAANKAR